MKSRNIVIAILVVAAVYVIMGNGQNKVGAQISGSSVKVGVVNVDQVLRNSTRHRKWQERMSEEEEKVKAEFKKLSGELKELEDDMKTRTRGSADYVRLMRQFAEKDGMLQARQEFYEKEVTLKVQTWTEQLYKEILDKTSEVASKLQLDVVLADEEVNIPAMSMRELLLGIRTNSVLYRSDRLDITDEVLEAVDGSVD